MLLLLCVCQSLVCHRRILLCQIILERKKIIQVCYLVYRFEDDPIIGHRLYREIRQAETKKVKTKGASHALPVSPQWETVATNLDEFQVVSVSFCFNISKYIRYKNCLLASYLMCNR